MMMEASLRQSSYALGQCVVASLLSSSVTEAASSTLRSGFQRAHSVRCVYSAIPCLGEGSPPPASCR